MGLRARSLCEDIALIRFPAGKHLSINRNHLSIDELNTVVTRIGPPRYFAGVEVFRETSVRVFRLYASRNELIDSAMSYGEMMHEAFRGGANEGGRVQRLQSVPAIRRRTQKSGARAKGAQE